MRIPIPTTHYHKIANTVMVFCLAGTFLCLFFFWPEIPQLIPAHYNFAGVIDRWDDKRSLWLLPVIALIMYAGMTILEHFPQAWNTGITVTEENRAAVYRTLKDLLITTKLMVVLIFTSLTANAAMAKPLPSWWTPIVLVLVFGTTLFYIVRLYKKK